MSGWRSSRSSSTLWVLWALLGLCAGCAKRELVADSPHILRISQRNEPATLDPQSATLPDEFFIIRAVGEGLLTPNPDGGAPLPGVAERYEVSPDGLTYTFYFRPNLKLSDGQPFMADDFRTFILSSVSPHSLHPKASLFFPLKNARRFFSGECDLKAVGVRAPSDNVLELELEHPNADFPAIIASGSWIPLKPDLPLVNYLGTGAAAGLFFWLFTRSAGGENAL